MAESTRVSTSQALQSPRTPEQLLQAITNTLHQGDIPTAEALNRQLHASHPMAIGEIVKATELIDDAKSASMDSDHLALWRKLYDTLSEDEQRCLYFSLKDIAVPPKKVLMTKGTVNSKLYFIESGTVAILQPKGDKTVTVARLGRGKLLGEYTFATIALCSATAVSMEELRLKCLDNKATIGWQDLHPGLYGKLIDFCMRHGSVKEILHRKETVNRSSIRYEVSGQVDAELLAGNGEKTGTRFRGEVVDISVSGMNFTFKCSKKSTARALLAKNLDLNLTFSAPKPVTMRIGGSVVGISYLLYNDYALHLRFAKRLPESVLHRISQSVQTD